jgi:hypothetical protein
MSKFVGLRRRISTAHASFPMTDISRRQDRLPKRLPQDKLARLRALVFENN